MEPEDLSKIIEQCESEDPIDRFEAFEELWDHIFHQGTPSLEASNIFRRLLDWVGTGHPDWASILDGICGCAIDLTEGPPRKTEENSRRIELLKTIIGGQAIFEAALAGPCSESLGLCTSHLAAGELMGIARPEFAGRWTEILLDLIRKNPSTHSRLWETVDRFAAFDAVSKEALNLCAEQTEFEPARRSALFHLTSRGDPKGANELQRAVNELALPRFVPTVEEVSILCRTPQNVPFDLLTGLYRRASDLRAIHDLACAILRKTASDERPGWELVSERRRGGSLWIRHPNVSTFKNPQPSDSVVACRDDLFRKPRLSLIDTDIWVLFGLDRPHDSAR